MKTYQVGIIGATGMVGQRFVTLLANHPWFHINALLASGRSAGKSYEEALGGRWCMESPLPESVRSMTVLDAGDIAAAAQLVDFVFCAVNLPKDEVRALEEAYAKAEIPVVSNNSACRWVEDVPMVIPELNPHHTAVIEAQRKRLGTKKGFIAVKSNCSIQSYVPALTPLKDRYGLEKVLACTYQAISGAGKTFERWPEMVDNLIPYIAGEEEKSEREPLKCWGRVEDGRIVCAEGISITSQCLRVPVTNGHMAAVFASFREKPDPEEIKEIWANWKTPANELDLPSAPKQFIHYFEDPARPQTALDRGLEGGMAISCGRLRPDSQYDLKFVCLSHNTLRGAAGGAVEMAELLVKQGWL